MAVVEKEISFTLSEDEIERKKRVQQKQNIDTFQVAFCGHFSAGKSTLLNHLLGADMLPTSPIPTSANIIGIKNGTLGLTVQSTEGKKTTWEGEIPWERVREWGMDGAEINFIQIDAPLPFLGNTSTIYDTPGVDSTDPTHQAVTLDALYDTDFIVYVMDYNHVQSETNLTFLKQLSDERKPLYIIINQIDKHNENELSIEAFDTSVRNTLSEWGINILQLRYTSMKDPDHPLNELPLFEKEIKTLLYYGNELLPYAKKRLQQGYYLSIIERLKADEEEEIDEVIAKLEKSGYTIDDLHNRNRIATSYEKALRAKETFLEEGEAQIRRLLQDVTIFPYTTTTLTREWLQSTEPSFKVGILFAKRKTEEERTSRLEKLLTEVTDQIQTQIQFHLQRFFRTYDLSLLSNRDEVEQLLADLQFTPNAQFFISSVQQGPKSREYVYTYTKERTDTIVRIFRQKAFELLQRMCDGMHAHWQSEIRELKEEMEHVKQLDEFHDEIAVVKGKYNKYIDECATQAATFDDQGEYERVIEQTMNKPLPTLEQETISITLPENTIVHTDWQHANKRSSTSFNEEEGALWIDRLIDTLQQYEQKEQLHEERMSLLHRAKNWKEQTFTISLFGAFSAGKSSFANALLGDNVLPVSPHPTTATVNTVKQSTANRPSKTAVVSVKTKEQLVDEIEAVAKQLDENVTLETLQKWKSSRAQSKSHWQKTYESYLETLQQSLSTTSWELGSTFEVQLEELEPFVANEHEACLIDEVTLYYDCELTKRGIVLIDTPGVNSIHSRHTNVAFTQLRDSDAIFYVSYYNHAFSKADEQFLEQMAKVNEQFSTDKLYFILNAADLASNEYELNGVRKHVYDQLVQRGVQKPRLYPLSSKIGLLYKQQKEKEDPLFTTFEDDFYTYTIAELKRLSFNLIVDELNRYVTTVNDGIHLATSEEKTKEKRRNQLVHEVNNWRAFVEKEQPISVWQMTVQEVKQLYLYLRERMTYVLNDSFRATVNVATVTGRNRRAQQDALYHALNAWRGEAEQFLQQEIEATSLRLQLALEKATEQWTNEMMKKIQASLPSFQLSYVYDLSLQMNYEKRLLPIELEPYSERFRSLKSFFEEQEVQKVREDIVNAGTEIVRETLSHIEKQTVDSLQSIFNKYVKYIKESYENALAHEVERFDMLTDPKHYEALRAQCKHLEKVLKEAKK